MTSRSRCIQACRVVHDRTNTGTGLHRHAHDELIYILQGRYRGRAAGRPLDLRPGHGVLIRAGTIHGCLERKIGRLVLFVLQWDGLAPPLDCMPFDDAGDRVGHPLARLVGIADAPGTEAEEHRDLLIRIIIREALWLAEPQRAPPAQDDPIARVQAHIERAYGAELDLDHLSAIADMSRASLTRHFRARNATSPMRYLRDVRLRHARRLVTTTTLSMREIADQVGIGDPGHLGRLLKGVTGSTIRDVRRRARSASASGDQTGDEQDE